MTRALATFLVGTAIGTLSGAAIVGVFLGLFGSKVDAWERRQIDKYVARFPYVPTQPPTYVIGGAQRTFGGVTSHVTWSDAPAT